MYVPGYKPLSWRSSEHQECYIVCLWAQRIPRRLTVSKLLTVTVFPENKRKNFAEMRVPESIITNQPFPELKRIKALEAVRSGGLCVSFQ